MLPTRGLLPTRRLLCASAKRVLSQADRSRRGRRIGQRARVVAQTASGGRPASYGPLTARIGAAEAIGRRVPALSRHGLAVQADAMPYPGPAVMSSALPL